MSKVYGLFVCATSYDAAARVMRQHGYSPIDFRYVTTAAPIIPLRNLTLIDLGGDREILHAAMERNFKVLEKPHSKPRTVFVSAITQAKKKPRGRG